jgi:hypothetical protein
MTDQQSMPQPAPDKDEDPALNQHDWYLENGFVVFTAAYHLKRRCTGSVAAYSSYAVSDSAAGSSS